MDQAQQLRNIIKHDTVRRHTARVITVTSGKGGVGKSNVAVNLGICLRQAGKRVVILDADFGLANIEVMLGIRPQYNLADLMFRGKNLTDIITYGPENLGFISGGSGIQELTNMTRDQLNYLQQRLFELDELTDYIIVDTGAGISDSVLQFVASGAEVLLVTTPEPTSITDAYALMKALNKRSEFDPENTVIKMIANRANSYHEGKELFEKLSVVVNKFLDIKLEYLGTVPQDSNISKSVMLQKPISLVYPTSKAAIAFKEMATMIDESILFGQAETKGIMNLFHHLIRSKYNK